MRAFVYIIEESGERRQVFTPAHDLQQELREGDTLEITEAGGPATRYRVVSRAEQELESPSGQKERVPVLNLKAI